MRKIGRAVMASFRNFYFAAILSILGSELDASAVHGKSIAAGITY
jgi:hypothetical protein